MFIPYSCPDRHTQRHSQPRDNTPSPNISRHRIQFLSEVLIACRERMVTNQAETAIAIGRMIN